jgi:Flp pilus assembly protein TadD
MRCARALVLLLAISGLTPSPAGPPVYLGPSGVGISFGRGRIAGSIYFGNYGPAYYAPIGYYVPMYASVPFHAPPPQQVVIVPRIQVTVVPAPEPPPVSDLRDEDYPDKIIIRPGQKTVRGPARPAEPPPMPAEPVRPPRPEDRQPPPMPREPEPIEPKAPWWPQLPPVPERPAPKPADPKAPLAQQQLDLGKQAFADPLAEYARAERRFQQAIEADPKQPLAHFYLAQAQFALGKYREAVASIHAGLRLQPTWPMGLFKARELYGPNAEEFAGHMERLQTALARQPNDPVLLFLYAYQLWFDGRRDDARPYFQRALPRVAEPRFIEMFLQAPMGPVVAR